MTSITMPQLGESVAEGTIGKWLKAPGEKIERDEPLVEVITDKVTAEIPSPVAGVLETIVVEEGQTVPIGREIAIITEAGAATSSSSAAVLETTAGEAAGPVSPTSAAGSAMETVSTVAQAQTAAHSNTEDADGDGQGERRRASPLVRRIAREQDIDLSELAGTGAGGRITKEDILAFVQARGSDPASRGLPRPLATEAHRESTGDEEYQALTPMRRAIAEHMVRSKQVSPDAWSVMEVDVSRLVRLRESALEKWQQREGFELTFMPFFVKAVVESLREHPQLNASWGEDSIVLKKRINIGVAVSITDGLLVPVIHDADQKSIAGLAHAIRDLATRARSAKLGIADVEGGTFTVNNTGALGSVLSAPIINQPQAAIITMEAIVKRPVVVEDAIAIRSMMNTCISFDHRILDGAAALRFLQSVKRRMEAYDTSSAIY